MRSRFAAALALVTTVAVALPAVAPARRPVRLRAFASCANLVDYAQQHFEKTEGVPAPTVAPMPEPPVQSGPGEQKTSGGEAAPTAAPAPSAPAQDSNSFSTTNVQEAGVDEPDVVKTNGTTIFAVVGPKVYAIAAKGEGAPKIVGSLDVGSYGGSLLLRGNRLVVIAGGYGVGIEGGGPAVAQPAIVPVPYAGQTVITEIDVHDPAAMTVSRKLTLDGQYVSSRQNGGTARIVLNSTPRAYAVEGVRDEPAGWVPKSRFASNISGRHRVKSIVRCDDVRRPPVFSGLGMISILTINLDKGLWEVDSDGVMSDAQIVYGSTGHLYVATQRWIDPRTPVAELPSGASTLVHRFDVSDPDHTTYEASGSVPGYLLNQFSMSEYKGDLRVASTSQPIWWNGATQTESQSHVTVLRRAAGVLAPVGSVSGLGKGQRITSVRFIDDVGYVVTFRQIDPLYTIDLADPTAPKVRGELELLGFSSYLHPIGKDLLLGVGQDATPEGRTKGVQVTLFDVSDPAAVKILAQHALGTSSSSQVEYDHHAFLYWGPKALAVLPVQVFDRGFEGPQPNDGKQAPQQGFTGAVALKVDRSGITEAGRIAHDALNGYVPPITRSIVIGGQLFTLSDGGVLASALDGFARVGWAAFPAPPQPYPDGPPPPNQSQASPPQP